MDTDPSHRPTASQEGLPERVDVPHHMSSNSMIAGGAGRRKSQHPPPSPKLAPSPTIAQAPPHAESSAQAARRAAAHLAEADHMYAPFVSPAPHSIGSRGGPTSPPPSAEHLRNAMCDESQSGGAPKPQLSRLSIPLQHEVTSEPAPVAPAPEPEASELLTCKPLDRVVSSNGAPSSQPSRQRVRNDWSRFQVRKPMERIVTQVGAPYVVHPRPHGIALKRARSLSDAPDSHRVHSVNAARHAARHYRQTPRKKMRVWTASDAAEAAEGERIMRQIRGRAQDHSILAAREPPVNMNTLRVLDTNEVLRLPQMRHDLLFDSFGFRPIHGNMAYPSANYGLLNSLRSQTVNPSPQTDASNRYWDCIRAEIEVGCRCTRWDPSDPSRVKDCICGRWKDGMSETQWWKESRATWPSRLPKLIETLREILESLMASTTPCVNHYAHSMNRGSQTAHAQLCPTITHSLVPSLFAALDTEFLTVQVRRGNFDTDIFRVIGDAMKVHCAPVRDEMVDEMVAVATGSGDKDGVRDVVAGLRKCFDCVEVMKLDIANHQVQSLKPMLWQQAEQNEMTTFINYLLAAGRTLETSKTYAWINAASKRVAMATAPRERRHIMGQCGCAASTEFVVRSLADGFIDLAFGDWVEPNETWPPIVPSRRPNTIPLTGQVYASKVNVPEVFKMDSCRIKNFHAEMVDIAIAQSILRYFRQQFIKHHPTATEQEVDNQVAQVRESYKHVMTHGPHGLARPLNCASDLGLFMADRIVFPHTTSPSQLHHPRPTEGGELSNRLAEDFDRMIAIELARSGSPSYQESYGQLRQLVHSMLTNTLLLHRVQPESFLYDMRGIDSKPCVRGEKIPTAPLLRVPARRFVVLTEPLTGQGPSTSDPRERYHRPADSPAVVAARDLFNDAQRKGREEDTALAATFGFEPLVNEIRAVVDRMVKTADFNLCVFANLYGRSGMLVGSGKLSPLPELDN